MQQDNLKNIIESLLFVSSKPLKIKDLSKLLETTPEQIKPAVEDLIEDKKNTGIVVLDNGGEYQLTTNPANSSYVKNFLNAELREKLTDATVEVLGIIAYRQPISKAEIEAIRGVNSQYSLRHLLMRGLIEKVQNPGDQRSFLYQTTTEFLQHMGLRSFKDLPDFEKLVAQIKLPETPATAEEKSAEMPGSKDSLLNSESSLHKDEGPKKEAENNSEAEEEAYEDESEDNDDDEDE